MSDNFRQAADKLPTSNSTSKTLSADKRNLVKSTTKARQIDPDAVGFSMKEMAEMLGMKRPTLADKLKSALSWDEFNDSGIALSAHKTSKVLYSVESWKVILSDLNIGLPAQLKPETVDQHDAGQSSALATIPVVEAEYVDPMDRYMTSALSFSNGVKPLAHRDTSFDVAQLQALATNATTAMNDFTSLLTEEEIQEAINRGSKRGAMKAALERQAEVKTYEVSMGGKPQGGEESPQSA